MSAWNFCKTQNERARLVPTSLLGLEILVLRVRDMDGLFYLVK